MTTALHVLPQYQPLFRELALDAAGVFTCPDIHIWRKLPDRENGTLDTLIAGRPVRLHVKRYPTRAQADQELQGHRLLEQAQIPTMTLAAFGHTIDNRSFVMFEDLAGYQPADKLIAAGMDFDRLLTATADLTAKLHNANLHHRDLYLCHFFAKIENDEPDIRLIDVARVAQLNNAFTRQRWIIKDLAQFWHSTQELQITDSQRESWLSRYAAQRGLKNTTSLHRRITKKSNAIARHDARLRARQPRRNISIPSKPE